MSSEGSVSSQGSRIRQFGLYRSIDARTEEFLRLSRKRQMRQGCACAAVSTAITVAVVVVILLIYEYAIAVEWSLVQRIGGRNGTYNITNTTQDTPFADRLDRSFFGFDQDYYERMPLLVNALQESNYVDPVAEISRPLGKSFHKQNVTIPRAYTPNVNKPNKLRKPSPRPFIFEYRSATPIPFSKTYGAPSWVDSYRNAQRLQNIRQIIRYLEKTINAKAGDMHVKPPSSHTSIAFSGVFVEPKMDQNKSEDDNSMELLQQNSDKVETYVNHHEDPYFNFKPDSPGEVNLLADTVFRFSPIPTPSITEHTESKKTPMFRRIPFRKKCRGQHCNESIDIKFNNLRTSTEQTTELPTSSTKSFSVMLNLYPLKPNENPGFKRHDERTRPPLEKIYLTTSKPLIQFRRKPAPTKRMYYRYQRPRYLSRNKNMSDVKPTIQDQDTKPTNSTTMIVHVDVFSPEDKNGFRNQSTIELASSTVKPGLYIPSTEKPVELYAGQVEDHHDGSSGFIPMPIPEQTETPSIPQVTAMTPLFETSTASTEINHWVTNPPDVVKFSAEDAKVPDHYVNLATTETVSKEKEHFNWETTQAGLTDIGRIRMIWHTTKENLKEKQSKNIDLATTNLPSTEAVSKNINWSATQAEYIDIFRRLIEQSTTQSTEINSMNEETTQSTPTEFYAIYKDLTTTQASNKITSKVTERGKTKYATTQTPMGRRNSVESEVQETLIIKLKNDATTTEDEYETTTEEYEDETTTTQTYVPQINGHYRNIIRNHSSYSPESYRKRKLEMSVTGFRSYVPMYVEIKRNKTKSVEDDEE